MQRCLKTVPFLALAILLAGCNSLQEKEMQKSLREVLHSYGATVRWGRLEQTYSFLQPDLAKQAKIPANLDGIQVTGYELIRQPAGMTNDNISQSALIRFVFKDRQVEKTMTDTQHWIYDHETKVWYRSNPIPEFK